MDRPTLISKATAVRLDLAISLSNPPSGDTLLILMARAGASSSMLCNELNAPLHCSALPGSKCADCSIDQEPCPTCYRVWWARRHPNVREV